MLLRVLSTLQEDVAKGDFSLACSSIPPGRHVRPTGGHTERLGTRALPNLKLLYEGCLARNAGGSAGRLLMTLNPRAEGST